MDIKHKCFISNNFEMYLKIYIFFILYVYHIAVKSMSTEQCMPCILYTDVKCYSICIHISTLYRFLHTFAILVSENIYTNIYTGCFKR